jgi:hypothetical protein
MVISDCWMMETIAAPFKNLKGYPPKAGHICDRFGRPVDNGDQVITSNQWFAQRLQLNRWRFSINSENNDRNRLNYGLMRQLSLSQNPATIFAIYLDRLLRPPIKAVINPFRLTSTPGIRHGEQDPRAWSATVHGPTFPGFEWEWQFPLWNIF